jgi:hypothetical protein
MTFRRRNLEKGCACVGSRLWLWYKTYSLPSSSMLRIPSLLFSKTKQEILMVSCPSQKFNKQDAWPLGLRYLQVQPISKSRFKVYKRLDAFLSTFQDTPLLPSHQKEEENGAWRAVPLKTNKACMTSRPEVHIKAMNAEVKFRRILKDRPFLFFLRYHYTPLPSARPKG